MIHQLIPAYGWTALLAVKGRWPRRVRLERWPVMAWVLEESVGIQEVVPYIADEDGFCHPAYGYSNLVGVLGPGEHARREHWKLAKRVAA